MVCICSERNDNKSLCFSTNIYILVDRLLSYDATYVASLLSKLTLLYCTLNDPIDDVTEQHGDQQEPCPTRHNYDGGRAPYFSQQEIKKFIRPR